ncbi:electron transport complex subunit RsxG [Tropicimonas sp. S265A]|uniref:electron transport complex subunit RsxG n=1 Tax=Tropicimonas sp. S265A TaxID=3415134 RepID=UPI003C7C269B
MTLSGARLWFETSPLRHGLLLGLFALSAAVILSASHSMTAATIALRLSEDRMASLRQVIPEALHDNDVSATVLEVDDLHEGLVVFHVATLEEEVSAIAVEVTSFGYAGGINVLIGVSADGTVLGARVLSHAETPGLGDKIERRKSDWIDSFAGTSLRNPAPEGWGVKKDGGVFDQFSGASITPRAVVQAVERGLHLFERNRTDILNAFSPEGRT